EIYEILFAPRRQPGGKVRSRAVIDIVTPGIRDNRGKPLREPAIHLRGKTVVERIPNRWPPGDVARETERAENRIVRNCLDLRKRPGQRVEGCLRRRR